MPCHSFPYSRVKLTPNFGYIFEAIQPLLPTDFKSAYRHLTDLLKRDKPIFTGLSAVKVKHVWVGPATNYRHLSVILRPRFRLPNAEKLR